MKVQHKRAAMRLTIIGMALGLAVVGCSKEDSKTEESSSTSSSSATSATSSEAPTSEATSSATPAAAPGDLSVLLMKPESIPPTPEGPFVGDPPQVDPNPPASVSQFYKAGDNSIQSSIFVVPDAAAATSTVQSTMSSPDLAAQITGTPEPAPNVTEDALVINGTSADGSASMSILMFSEETAVVQVTFIGKLSDPVPADFLESVGVIQLDAVQQGLPTLGG